MYSPDPLDGEKIWMVATECIMTLFAMLYAFPHIPGSLLDDVYDEDSNQTESRSGFLFQNITKEAC